MEEMYKRTTQEVDSLKEQLGKMVSICMYVTPLAVVLFTCMIPLYIHCQMLLSFKLDSSVFTYRRNNNFIIKMDFLNYSKPFHFEDLPTHLSMLNAGVTSLGIILLNFSSGCGSDSHYAFSYAYFTCNAILSCIHSVSMETQHVHTYSPVIRGPP